MNRAGSEPSNCRRSQAEVLESEDAELLSHATPGSPVLAPMLAGADYGYAFASPVWRNTVAWSQ